MRMSTTASTLNSSSPSTKSSYSRGIKLKYRRARLAIRVMRYWASVKD
jgi:hypothetical protein